MNRDAPPPPATAASPATSPALAVTGFLMVLVLFLIANRIPGLDPRLPAWPWEVFVAGGHPLAPRVLVLLWGLTGAILMIGAFSARWRLRAGFALGAAALLLVECTQGSAGLTSEVYNFNQLFPMVLLGGGLLLARRPGRERAGRALGVLGGAGLLLALAAGFTESGVSLLGAVFYDIRMLLDGTPLPDQHPYYHHYTTVPRALVTLAAVAGPLACLLVPHRHVLLGCALVLGVGLLLPFEARIYALSQTAVGVTAGGAVQATIFILVDHGLALWLLGTFAIADWREPEAEPA